MPMAAVVMVVPVATMMVVPVVAPMVPAPMGMMMAVEMTPMMVVMPVLDVLGNGSCDIGRRLKRGWSGRGRRAETQPDRQRKNCLT